MKKIFILMLSVIISVSFCACSKNETKSEKESQIVAEYGESAKDTENDENNALTKKSSSANKSEIKQGASSGGSAGSSGSSGSKSGGSGSLGTEKSPNQGATEKTTKKETAKTTEKDPKTFNVSVSISCKNALPYDSSLPQSGYFLQNQSVKVKDGDTVFDALYAVAKENDITLKYQSPSYIQGINGLNEKDCTSSSGWMYKVNGNAPTKAANKEKISSNDKITWYYVTTSSDTE